MLDAIMAQCRNTSLIMGVIALVGLLLQKKPATDVISGTMKTVIGFMVFNIGSNAMSACVTTFTTLFNTAFGIEGVTTQVEVATGLEATRVKEIGNSVNLTAANTVNTDFGTYSDQDFLGYTNLDEPEGGDFIAGAPGSTFTFKTREKAIDITFCGTLYIEIDTGNNRNTGLVGDSDEKYRQGTIHSAGDEPVTIKLADKVDGHPYPSPWWVRTRTT